MCVDVMKLQGIMGFVNLIVKQPLVHQNLAKDDKMKSSYLE